MARQIQLPNNWVPRPYQRHLWDYLEAGGKRAVAVWHRRAGKDDVALHITATKIHERPGTYWHLLPEAAQARKAVWDAINGRTGKRRIDEAFPLALRDNTRENEMFIRFKCGSTWQVVGSDNYNSLVGSPPVGIVFSEYALADPGAWNYLRPILAENGGWSLFIYTPRGRNHGADLYDMARLDPAWFAERLTVDDTGVIPAEVLEQERREMDPHLFKQEYFCSFDSPIVGSYYGELLAQAEAGGRICKVPYEPKLRVTTAWDLGIGDDTAIWFVQQTGHEVRLIDYYENRGVGLDHYVKVLSERPYAYAEHLLPHDVEVRELGTGTSRLETLRGFGIGNCRVVPRVTAGRGDVDDGIQAVRGLLPRCWFDAERCAAGLKALRQYRRRYDEQRAVFSDAPLHDWTSHAADAFRYLARGLMSQDVTDRVAAQNRRYDAWVKSPESWRWIA